MVPALAALAASLVVDLPAGRHLTLVTGASASAAAMEQ